MRVALGTPAWVSSEDRHGVVRAFPLSFVVQVRYRYTSRTVAKRPQFELGLVVAFSPPVSSLGHADSRVTSSSAASRPSGIGERTEAPHPYHMPPQKSPRAPG